MFRPGVWFTICLLFVAVAAYNQKKEEYGTIAPVVRPNLLEPNPNFGSKFDGFLLTSRNVSENPWAGQELRGIVRTSMLNHSIFERLTHVAFNSTYSAFPAWNYTLPSVRVRVIAAFSSRGSTGDAIQCDDGASHDVWSETWTLSPKALIFGMKMSYSGYFTFTAPPFPFRVCVKNTIAHNLTVTNRDRGLNKNWREFRNWEKEYGLRVFYTREPIFLFTTTSTNYVGDFGYIKVFSHANETTYDGHSFDPLQFSTHDSIKLVPMGFPCTYEKPFSQAGRSQTTTPTTVRRQYCGANMVAADGTWRHTTCPHEGAVEEGIPHIGSNRQNPLVTDSSNYPSDFVSGNFELGTYLTGYLRWHTAGKYDVCVSTRSYRVNALNSSTSLTDEGSYARDAHPVWFKAYNANSSSCNDVDSSSRTLSSSCVPRQVHVTVSSSVPDVTWTLSDRTHGSWAEMEFKTTSGQLNYNPASAWDHSNPREYALLQGGDQFRLVHIDKFPPANPNPLTDFGEVYTDASGNRHQLEVVTEEASTTTAQVTATVNVLDVTTSTGDLSTSGESKSVFHVLRQPGLGTQLSSSYPGCFYSGDDNYGNSDSSLNGNPASQCCSPTNGECSAAGFCEMNDAGIKGPTASADLGGHPRTSTTLSYFEQQPWTLDGQGASAFGYIRVPSGGKWIVCYRRDGGNWRTATAADGGNTTFTPRPLHDGFTYHINDTRASTYGPVEVRANAGSTGTLSYKNWNFFTNTLAEAAGSAFKMVKETENCQTSAAYSKTWSFRPGAHECAATPLPTGECLGSLDDNLDARQSVYFYVKLPPYLTTTKFRICFRRGAENWRQLSAPNYSPHTYMTSASLFHPKPEARVEFTLSDNVGGTWGKIIVRRHRRHASTTYPLDSKLGGDIVRLVPNVSFSGESYVRCDLSWGTGKYSSLTTTQKYQEYDPATVKLDLATYCTSTTSSWCSASLRYPTVGGINAHYPYTDVVPQGDDEPILTDDGIVAFLTIPPPLDGSGRQLGYKVCYKERGQNWIEALDVGTGAAFLTVKSSASVTISSHSQHLTSGSYAFFELQSTRYPIQWSVDVAKLVPYASTCEVPAVGTSGYDNDYISIAGVSTTQHGRGQFVDSSSTSQIESSAGTSGESMTARIYVTLPTVSSAFESTAQYRLCYMKRTSSSDTANNWHDLSTTPITVHHLGIQYTALNTPLHFSYVGVRFLSESRTFNTLPHVGDRAKIVSGEYPCSDSSFDTQPSVSPSTHVGLEFEGNASGVYNLGPDDAFATKYAVLNTVLPAVTYLKVCFKPLGLPWMEVGQAGVLHRVHSLPSTGLTTSSSSVTGCTVDTQVYGQEPSSSHSDYVDGTAYTSVIVGGSATASSSSSFLSVTLSSADSTSVQDSFRFVRVATELEPGVFKPTGALSCNDATQFLEVPSGTSTTVNIATNMPSEAGKYLVCYRKNETTAWLQPPPASGTQPFTVIDNQLRFNADSLASLIVSDYFGNGSLLGGGVSGNDLVYLSNGTASCGVESAFDNTSPSDAYPLNATSYTTNVSAPYSRRATEGSVTYPTSGTHTVCVYRSHDYETMGGTTRPFLKDGWYQVANGGLQHGARSSSFVRSAVVDLAFSGCPFSNSTWRLRSGNHFDIDVSLVDSSGKVVAENGMLISAATNGFDLENSRSACSAAAAPHFGASPFNLVQPSYQGSVRFRLTPLSACPVGSNCSITFTTSQGGSTVTSSKTCSFHVRDTQVHETRIVDAPSSCNIGESCKIRAAAFHADGELAYTATDAVAVYITNAPGLGANAFIGGKQVSISTSSVTNLQNGYVVLDLTFTPQDFNVLADTSLAVIQFEVNAKRSTSASITVMKPKLTAVHVTDVFPAYTNLFPQLPDQPTWEPQSQPLSNGKDPLVFSGGFSDVLNGRPNVDAAEGYHLVAGQFYTFVLRAVAAVPGGAPRYVPSNQMMNSQMKITATIDNATENSLIGIDGCIEEHICAEPFAGKLFSQPSELLTFRVKNSHNCSRLHGGCTIRFKFDGVDIGDGTTITTPVRSPAAALRHIDGQTTTTINDGWRLTVDAVDMDGIRDEFLEGTMSISLINPPAGVTLTANTSTINKGRSIATFSLSRPCNACRVVLHASTVAAPLVLRISAAPNTEKLSCALETNLHPCVLSGDECTLVKAANTSTADGPMVYSNTRFCVSATAVDTAMRNTLYETNWVSYQAVSTDGEQLTVTDADEQQAFRKRYKPMVRSSAMFCIKVSSQSTSAVKFDIHFQAQRFNDPGYWATKNGRCLLGTFTLLPKKIISDIQIAASEELTPVPQFSNRYAAEYRGSTIQASLSFKLVDHYGSPIEPAELQSDQKAYSIALISGSNGYVSNTIHPALNGILTATTTNNQVTVTETPLALPIALSGYCLHCSLSVEVLNGGGSSLTTRLVKDVVLHIINSQNGLTRQLSFQDTYNPLSHFTTAVAPSSSSPVLHDTSCWSSSCAAYHSSLLRSVEDESGQTDTLSASGNAPIRMFLLKVDGGSSLDSRFQSKTWSDNSLLGTQVDIMTTYDVTVSTGNQRLRCVTYGKCSNDGTTAPSQSIASLGSNLLDAVAALNTYDDLPSASFALQGEVSSEYYAQTTDGRVTSAPSVMGPLKFDGSSRSQSIHGINTTRVLAWRGPLIAQRILVSSTAKDTSPFDPSMYECYSASGACAFEQSPTDDTNGWPRSATLNQIGFSYAAQPIPTGAAFPMSVDVVDANDDRVTHTNGTLIATLDSWYGCNDGGTMIVNNTAVVSGRATVWVSFSAPCQNCRIRFDLTPNSTQDPSPYTTLDGNIAGLRTISEPVTIITQTVPNATHVVLRGISRAKPTMSITDVVELSLQVRGNLGLLARDTNQPATVAVMKGHQPPSSRGPITTSVYGNGGILRRGLAAHTEARHMNSVILSDGKGVVTFAFTRTCLSCQVWLLFRTERSHGSFTLAQQFKIETQIPALSLLSAPRRVFKKQDFVASITLSGSELANHPTHPIAYAGKLNEPALSAMYNVVNDTASSFAVVSGGNGVGGTFSVAAMEPELTGPHVVSHVVQFSESCDACLVTVGGLSFETAVVTKATHLRLIFGSFEKPFRRLGTGDVTSYNLIAADEDGAIDVLFGNTNCKYGAYPFHCGNPSQAIPTTVTLHNMVNGLEQPFFPQFDNGLSTGITEGTVVTGGLFVNGRTSIGVNFPLPVRHASVRLNAGSVVSPLVGAVVPTLSVADAQDSIIFSVNSTLGATTIPKQPIPFDVVASVKKATNSSEGHYLAPLANNTVYVKFVTCPNVIFDSKVVDTASSAPNFHISFTLHQGYKRVAFAFDNALNKTCSITFSFQNDGEATCGAGNVCSKELETIVNILEATTFSISEPTAIDNGGVAGLIFGVPGRSTNMVIQLSVDGAPASCGVDCVAVVSVNPRRDGDYVHCSVDVTIGAFDNTTGKGVVDLSWGSSAAFYKCDLDISINTGRDDYAVSDPIGKAIRTVTVELRQPQRIVFVTNVTTQLPRVMLTSVSYPFLIKTVDANGNDCPGDSQQSATKMSIEVVNAAGSPIPEIKAFNVNFTNSHGVRTFERGTLPPAPTAQMVNGHFQLNLVFTGSSTRLNLLGGVRLKITSTSDSRVSAVMSQPFDTAIAASSMHFRPNMVIPEYIVMNQPVITCCKTKSVVGVEVVDSLAEFGLKPNIVSHPSESGASAQLLVSMVPAFVNGFPFNSSSGSFTDAALQAGQYSWNGLVWTASEGTYVFSVAVPNTPMVAQTSFTVQKIARLAIGSCTGNCLLPKFYSYQNATIQDGPFMISTSLQMITVDVQVVDGRNNRVLGDDGSVVELVLSPDADTDIKVTVEPFFDVYPRIFGRVKKGIVTLQFALSGSTQSMSNPTSHLLAGASFRCPAIRPKELLLPGESPQNPCADVAPLNSMNIYLTDARPDKSLFEDPVVLLKKVTLKLRLTSKHTSLFDFNVSHFKRSLADSMTSTGNFTYISLDNAEQILNVQLCSTTPFFEPGMDLGFGVCHKDMNCALPYPAACPPQVLACRCPGTTRATEHASLLSRYLLQVNTTNQTNVTAPPATTLPDYNGSIALEVYFDLQQASGFQANDARTVAAEYELLQQSAMLFLGEEAWSARFGINATATSQREWNSRFTYATPTPPTPPPSDPPTPPPQGPATIAPTTGTAPMTALMAIFVALLFHLV